jgi:hypothetical protein
MNTGSEGCIFAASQSEIFHALNSPHSLQNSSEEEEEEADGQIDFAGGDRLGSIQEKKRSISFRLPPIEDFSRLSRSSKKDLFSDDYGLSPSPMVGTPTGRNPSFDAVFKSPFGPSARFQLKRRESKLNLHGLDKNAGAGADDDHAIEKPR